MTVTPEHVRQSNLIEGINSRLSDEVGWAAWLWLREQEEITPRVVLTTHLLAVVAQHDLPARMRGNWRTHDVTVGGRPAGAPWRLVPQLMREWCEYGLDQPPRAAHVEFENIHPLADGNGRTGRLLLWWHQVRLGQEPVLLLADERQDYYRWFRDEES